MSNSGLIADGLFAEPLSKYKTTPKMRTKQINLVLLAGGAAVGKTTAAKYLYSRLTMHDLNVVHTAFAKPLKEIAKNCFGWDGKKDERGRRLLQVIGTEAGRAYDEEIWVRYLENEELSRDNLSNFVLVDDWRYPNEKTFYTKNFLYDVTTIRIENPRATLSEGLASHVSEQALPHSKENLTYTTEGMYNFVVENNSTFEELYHKLGSVVNYLESKIITY